MNSQDPFVLITVACFVVCLALSIRTFFMKLVFFDRFSPIILQLLIAVISVLPLLHGSPDEWFEVLVIVFCWSLFALVSSYRLYRLPIRTLKILGFLQFVETVANLLLALFNYGSCVIRIVGLQSVFRLSMVRWLISSPRLACNRACYEPCKSYTPSRIARLRNDDLTVCGNIPIPNVQIAC